MPQYFSPGVYVEEVDSGPRPIQGVSTSVTGAVGVTERGPSEGKPVLVTSFGEFTRLFGGFLTEPDAATKAKFADDGQWWLFAYAVRSFFDNGGQQLFIKRVIAQDASKASKVFGQGIISEILGDAKADAKTLKVRHVITRDTSDSANSVTLVNGQTKVDIGDFKITSYAQRATECEIQLDKELGQKVSAARGDYLRFADLSNTSKRIKLVANSPGSWGDSIRVTVRPMVGGTLTVKKNEEITDGAAVTTLASEANDPAIGSVWTIELQKTTGFADGDTVRIDKRKYHLTLVSKNTVQELKIKGSAPPSSSFQLEFRGQKTGPIAADATLTTVKAALESLSTIKPGNVDCTGSLPAALTITFKGDLASKTIEKLTVVEDNRTAWEPEVKLTQIGGNATVRRDGEGLNKWVVGTEVRKMRKAGDSTKTKLYLSGASRLYKEAMIELDNGTRREFHRIVDVGNDNVTLDSGPTLSLLEGDSLHVIEAEVFVEYAPGGIVQESELFQNLKLVSPDSDDSLLITNHLKKRSRLIEPVADATTTLVNTSLAEFPFAAHEPLVDGDNDFESLNVNNFIGENNGSGQRTGIQAFEDIEDISIVMAPGIWSETVITELLTHCETMRYRVAVIDAPLGATISSVKEYRENFDSSRGALYHPWLKVRNATTGDNVDAPPSGAIAGIYADVDTRRGVHKAPANEVIKSIIGLQQDITRREQDLINPKGINALRFFPGRGNRVWGARTISSDTNFRYINVRRIFNFIERSIDEGTQFVVFEPNDSQLWSRVRQTINNFLNTQWRAGMLEGRTAEEAYFVACDRGATMTQDDIENGRLICQVGIAPVYPAEFVIFRIQKFTADSKLA